MEGSVPSASKAGRSADADWATDGGGALVAERRTRVRKDFRRLRLPGLSTGVPAVAAMAAAAMWLGGVAATEGALHSIGACRKSCGLDFLGDVDR